MVVHRLVRTVIAYADGVQMTGNGLVEVGLTGTEGFLDGAVAATALVVASEDTIFVVDDGGHQIALAIGIDYALTVDNGTRLGAQFVPNDGKHFFQLFHFFQLNGRSRIAFNTTLPFAGIQVAKELLAKHIETHYYVAYLYHNYSISLTN
jgi:hypothetical protein